MNKDKIAILTDSGCDVPREFLEKYPIYVLPLSILFQDGEYRDGVDISAQEVYARLAVEIPKTSLPNGQQILDTLEQIRADGYEKVFAVTISSGLSGTCNLIKLMCRGYKKLKTYVLDSRNISIGAGILTIQAARYAEEGMEWEQLLEMMPKRVPASKIFFCVKTLDYLQKGGRIGLVTAVLGSALKLKPVISCNSDGVYYTVAKSIGRKASIQRVLELAASFAQGCDKPELMLMHGGAPEEAAELEVRLKERLPGGSITVRGQISPSLVVHTGPGLLGIGVLKP